MSTGLGPNTVLALSDQLSIVSISLLVDILAVLAWSTLLADILAGLAWSTSLALIRQYMTIDVAPHNNKCRPPYCHNQNY